MRLLVPTSSASSGTGGLAGGRVHALPGTHDECAACGDLDVTVLHGLQKICRALAIAMGHGIGHGGHARGVVAVGHGQRLLGRQGLGRGLPQRAAGHSGCQQGRIVRKILNNIETLACLVGTTARRTGRAVEAAVRRGAHQARTLRRPRYFFSGSSFFLSLPSM
jgi:hypothetical protein